MRQKILMGLIRSLAPAVNRGLWEKDKQILLTIWILNAKYRWEGT
jgi:hypothetical protein